MQARNLDGIDVDLEGIGEVSPLRIGRPGEPGQGVPPLEDREAHRADGQEDDEREGEPSGHRSALVAGRGGGVGSDSAVKPAAFSCLKNATLLSPFVRQRLRFFVAIAKTKDLETVIELIEAGKVTP